MPRRSLDAHFEEERPEWTERKHRLLGKIVVPSAAKMKMISGRLAFVDGYAGPNSYGGAVQGSTTILTETAQSLATQGYTVKVFACEPSQDRYNQLMHNLQQHVQSGLLTAYNRPHSEALLDIQRQISGWPAFVFLDPHGPKDLQLQTDLAPWLRRDRTDVLGIFMANAAARACAEASSSSGSEASRVTAQAILGPDWRKATTEEDAVNLFRKEISKLKRFVGLYSLRKRDTNHRAYAVFGASASEHGFHLHSDAVARDWGALKDFDYSRKQPNLFSELDREDEQREAFEALVSFVAPVVAKDPTLTGQKLALDLYRSIEHPGELFGKFVERDFTKAAQACRKSKPNG